MPDVHTHIVCIMYRCMYIYIYTIISIYIYITILNLRQPRFTVGSLWIYAPMLRISSGLVLNSLRMETALQLTEVRPSAVSTRTQNWNHKSLKHGETTNHRTHVHPVFCTYLSCSLGIFGTVAYFVCPSVQQHTWHKPQILTFCCEYNTEMLSK